MKENNKIKPFESALIGFNLSKVYNYHINNNAEKEANLLFDSEPYTRLDAIKSSELVNGLFAEINRTTLGSLINEALKVHNYNDEALYEKTGLNEAYIKDIKADEISTNEIPVRSLSRLIKVLNLEISKVVDAIKVTFDRLKIEKDLFFTEYYASDFAIRRKDGVGGKENIASHKVIKYHNEEILNKYINRLQEIYSEL